MAKTTSRTKTPTGKTPKQPARSKAFRLSPYRVEDTTITLEEWRTARDAETAPVHIVTPRSSRTAA